MFVATSLTVPTSGSIPKFTLKQSSHKTPQRAASIAPCAFIFQKQTNASNTSDATLRQSDNNTMSSHAMTAAAASDHKQHSSPKRDSETSRATRKAIEGTNLFSMDDDYSWITVEDLLTA
jgi:hypothetical protein